jgi:hypothetical protein
MLGTGFPRLLFSGLDELFLSTIVAIVDLTVIIDCHCRGVKLIEDQTKFIDQRNAVQHRLLSLPSGLELKEGAVKSTSVYECTRLACMIYGSGVTFPLPSVTGVFHRLASTLKTELETSRADPCWLFSSKALLWILVFGGIAARGTKERSWYVQNMLTVTSVMKLVTWKAISTELKNFLWLDSACDSAGQELWSEVNSLER